MTDSQKRSSAKLEPEQIWEEMLICITPGDIIESKKGILSKSPLTGNHYAWKKGEYLGRGQWRVIGEKKEIDVS